MANKEPTGLIAKEADERQERERCFRNLVMVWKRERGPYSSSAQLAEHPAYQQIIGMGADVVPLVLAELEHVPDHWFRALHALTGADPVPPACRGNIRAMADAWLCWIPNHQSS